VGSRLRQSGLRHDRLADIGSDDERNTRAKTVSLVPVHAGDNIDDSLAHGNHHPEEFLRAVNEGPILTKKSYKF